MSKKKEHSFSSVISINPYTHEFYTNVSNFLAKADNPEYSTDQFAISFLNTKSFIHSQIAISKNIPEEDVYDAIYNKAYDELALDQAVEYNIQIIESFNNLDEENRNFHVFIVDPTEFKEIFKDVIETVNYIDVIISIPLLLKSLYTKEIIDTNGADCFVYLQENDAFLTIYREKEFLYTKSLRFSMVEMHERFCEIHGERIDYNDFKSFIASVNLKYTESKFKESLIKLYKELFTNVSDVISYTKRAFELDKIDNIYIGASLYFKSKIDKMMETELAIRSRMFEFDYGFESAEVYIDQAHPLLHLYTTIAPEEKYIVNFTLYPRPPKFLQRESGKLIAVAAASFVLAFIYPVTYWILAYVQSLQLDLLKEEYNEIHNIHVTRKATIKNKKADLDRVSALLKDEQKEFKEKKDTLIKIKKVKNDYIMKAKILSIFTKDLNRYNVKLESLQYTENNNTKEFTFDLVSSRSSRVTRLLKHVTKVYEDSFKFDLNKIYYDKESGVYFSRLKATKL